DTWQDAAKGFGLLLRHAPSAMNLDVTKFRDACYNDPQAACVMLATSNYAGSHYLQTEANPGGTLWEVYQDGAYSSYWGGLAVPPYTAVTTVAQDQAPPATADAQAASVEGSAYEERQEPRRFNAVRVANGETLSGLAARYRTTVAYLCEVNGIKDPNFIEAGAYIKVPV
ncbi:MAG: LysM peptidoglycan-binding domain-containing protein, partial [Acidobacteriaceae bacterium]